jgi:transcription antitermination factor NusG
MKFKIGDKVILNGYIYVSSNAGTPARKITNKITNITRLANGSKHPYNTTGDLGWCDELSLKLYEEKKEDKKYECEIELTDKSGLIEYLKNHDDKIIMIDSKDLKDILGL